MPGAECVDESCGWCAPCRVGLDASRTKSVKLGPGLGYRVDYALCSDRPGKRGCGRRRVSVEATPAFLRGLGELEDH
ncbi:MAG: NADH-ubiquinone oxidoreductase-F iron-sulfur binding region domain-containing protein, partial [Xanthobacteraceae bacterium]